MTDKATRYVTVLYHGGEPTWFTLDKPPIGLPELTTRVKIGSHYYFLNAEAPIVDAASGTTLIFVQALSHHSLGGHNIDPEGHPYELTKVDRHDFHTDANWREIDNPFSGLGVQVAAVQEGPRAASTAGGTIAVTSSSSRSVTDG